MRNAFADETTKIAAENPKLVMLSGDIGNRLFNDYKAQFPDRFYNCGVAEANMMSVAAGLALCGLRPIAYTITPFITTRCYEQIRVDVCYHNVPVIIVAVGAGLSYASLGATHHSCEDIAIMRALPNMTVIAPADSVEVRLALRAAIAHDGPVYIRMGKKGEPVVHTKGLPSFQIGKAITLRQGSDVCLLSTGLMLPIVLEAAQQLAEQGVSAQVASFHTIKPLDIDYLQAAFSHFAVVTTIEEHSIIGGFGGSVAEWLVSQPQQKARLVRIGTPDAFLHHGGDTEYARESLGLTATQIAQQTLAKYAVKAAP